VPTGIGGCWPAIQTPVSPQFADVSYFAQTPGEIDAAFKAFGRERPDAGRRLTSTSGAVRPFSNGGKRSNEKPSNKDAACISRQSQPEPSNQMSQTLS
jgi:hypothetical protein